MASKDKKTELFLAAQYHYQANSFQYCIAILKSILAEDRTDINALCFLINVYTELGDTLEARKALRQYGPDCLAGSKQTHLVGSLLLEMGDSLEAVQIFEEGIAQFGSTFEVEHDLGVAYANLKKYEEAAKHFDMAKKLNPNSEELNFNIGRMYDALKQHTQALESYDRAISIDPNYAQAWYNKGATLHDLARYDEALQCYDKALAIEPKYAQAWSNKGVTYGVLGRYEQALEFFKKAYALDPGYADGGWNQSLMKLLLGDFLGAWKTYECRWKKDDPHPYLHPHFPLLQSLQDIKGKSILVWSEQGFGDTIHFGRYVPMLSNLGADVIFEVQAPLKALIESLSDCKVISRGEPFPPPNFQIPLLSLPALFGTEIETIPASIPYLSVREDKVLDWKNKLNLNSQKINIGIACSGNSKHQNDLNRSMPLQFFSTLLENPRVELFLIQKELRDTDKAFFEQQDQIHFLGNEINDFLDSAAIIQNVDLIISVDTSLAHLAGALGKTVFLLLPWDPEWRWLLQRSDSPWYPTMKIFRQPLAGKWDEVMINICKDLNSHWHGWTQ